MATTLNTRFQVQSLGGLEYLSPLQVIGQDTEGTRQLVRNDAWVWSYGTRRVFHSWRSSSPMLVTHNTFQTIWRVSGQMSSSRTRLVLISDGDDVRVKVEVFQSDLTTSITSATNTHSTGTRNQLTSTLTGISVEPVYIVVSARYDTTAGSVYGVVVRELGILQADL